MNNKTTIHIISGLQQAGAETLLYRLLESDKVNREIKHVVISLTDLGFYGKRFKDIDIEVHTLNLSVWNFFLKYFQLFYLLSKNNPACVHCWMYHGNLIGGVIAKLAGVKNIIWSVHHLNVDKSSLSLSSYIASKLCSLLSPIIPHKIIYVSQASMDEHIKSGYRNKRNLLIYNFVNTKKFVPSLDKRNFMRTKYKIDQDVFVIGCVARWNECKGHKYLFDSLSKIKSKGREFKFVLVGVAMNSYNQPLMQLLKKFKLNDHVILLDCIDNIEDIYPMFDIHVLPSISEAFGLVTIEAMSCGVPILSSNVGSSSLIIDNSRYIYNYDDVNLLANKLIKRMDESDKNHFIGETLRERVEQIFSLVTALKAYQKAWFD